MFARIGDVLPRFRVYEKLFPDHGYLISALSVAYVDIVIFCIDAKMVFRKGTKQSGMVFPHRCLSYISSAGGRC
jgi:hypothetical protein